MLHKLDAGEGYPSVHHSQNDCSSNMIAKHTVQELTLFMASHKLTKMSSSVCYSITLPVWSILYQIDKLQAMKFKF